MIGKYSLDWTRMEKSNVAIDKDTNNGLICSSSYLNFVGYEIYERNNNLSPVLKTEDIKEVINFLKENDKEGWDKGVYFL